MIGDPWSTSDPAWSLDGRVIRHQQPHLRTVVGLLLSESPAALVVPTMALPDAEFLYERVFTRQVPEFLLDDVADFLALSWVGMPLWQAERFWRETIGAWSRIDGSLLYRGVDLMALSPRRATNVLLEVWPRLLGEGWDQWWAKMSAEPARELARRMEREPAEDVSREWEDAFAAFEQMERREAGVTGSDGIDLDGDTL